MVNRREADAHQCTGTSGSVSGTEDLCHGQVSCGCFDSDRQHFSESLHQSFRGDTFPSIAVQLWKWCLDWHISLTAEHLPGRNNQVADKEFRAVRDCCNWMIHPEIFTRIHQEMGPLDVDLFASRLTYQLPRFYSWRLDPPAEATDAFTHDWSQLHVYANPPWCLILWTLSKIQHEEAKVLLIAPVWRMQPWYPLLL